MFSSHMKSITDDPILRSQTPWKLIQYHFKEFSEAKSLTQGSKMQHVGRQMRPNVPTGDYEKCGRHLPIDPFGWLNAMYSRPLLKSGSPSQQLINTCHRLPNWPLKIAPGDQIENSGSQLATKIFSQIWALWPKAFQRFLTHLGPLCLGLVPSLFVEEDLDQRGHRTLAQIRFPHRLNQHNITSAWRIWKTVRKPTLSLKSTKLKSFRAICRHSI